MSRTVEAPEPKTQRVKAALLTRRELADAHGVNMRTVSKWEEDGMPRAKRGARGVASLYDPGAVTAWLEAREVARHPELGAPVDGPVVSLEVERARKERAQARLAEQTYLTRSRELVPVADVEKAWAARIVACKAHLLAVPQTRADEVTRAAVTIGVGAVEAVLGKIMREALRELAGEGDV